MPSAAIPAAKVTACCSAIPTSKTCSGNEFAILSSPVPEGIAAVIATILLSFAARSVSESAKTEV